MQREELLKLRQRVVESAQQLVMNGTGRPEDRLRILVDMIASGDASLEASNKAFELAQSLDDDDQKLSALLDIVYGVDQSLARAETVPSRDEKESSDNYGGEG